MNTELKPSEALRPYRAPSPKMADEVDLSSPVAVQQELMRLKRKRRSQGWSPQNYRFFNERIKELDNILSTFETPDLKYRRGESSGVGIVHKTGRLRAGKPNIGRPKGPGKNPHDRAITSVSYHAKAVANMLRGSVVTPDLFVQLSISWRERDIFLDLLEKLPHYLRVSQNKCLQNVAG